MTCSDFSSTFLIPGWPTLQVKNQRTINLFESFEKLLNLFNWTRPNLFREILQNVNSRRRNVGNKVSFKKINKKNKKTEYS